VVERLSMCHGGREGESNAASRDYDGYTARRHVIYNVTPQLLDTVTCFN
jgi:hypothetical protein